MSKNRTGRQLNWDVEEIEALVAATRDNIEDIQYNPLKPKSSFANFQRKKAWERIANAVNSINGGRCTRSVDECRSKWTGLKHQAKKDNDARRITMRKTGGGTPDIDELPEWQLQILELCGNDKTEGTKLNEKNVNCIFIVNKIKHNLLKESRMHLNMV